MEKFTADPVFEDWNDDAPMRSVPFGAGGRANVVTLDVAVSTDLEDNHARTETGGIHVPASKLIKHADYYRTGARKGYYVTPTDDDLALADYFIRLAGQ